MTWIVPQSEPAVGIADARGVIGELGSAKATGGRIPDAEAESLAAADWGRQVAVAVGERREGAVGEEDPGR